MNRYWLLLFVLLNLNSIAQKSEISINWKGLQSEKISEDYVYNFLSFDGAAYFFEKNQMPHVTFRQPIGNINDKVSAAVEVLSSRPAASEELKGIDFSKLSTNIKVDVSNQITRTKKFAEFTFLPIFLKGNTVYLAEKVTINVNIQKEPALKSGSSSAFTTNSVLASGEWAKIRVDEEGVFKISLALLQQSGLNLEGKDITDVRVFGGKGGMLPELNSEPRIDDLEEISLYINDNGDGRISASDFVLFYAQDADSWQRQGSQYIHYLNRYEKYNYYFVTTSSISGSQKRIGTIPHNMSNPSDTVITSFVERHFIENDLQNFIKSGRNWYGEPFGLQNELSFKLSFLNVRKDLPATLDVSVAARSTLGSSSYRVSVNGLSNTANIPSVSSVYYADFGNQRAINMQYFPNGDIQDIVINFNPPSTEARAWLDYIRLNIHRELRMGNNPLFFRYTTPHNNPIWNEFQIISSRSNLQLWDVTEVTTVYKQEFVINANTLGFKIQNSGEKEYVLFDPQSNQLKSPQFIELVENQNLHALSGIEYIIISPAIFLNQANELAQFHRVNSNLNTEVIQLDKIYNEFSSGKQDISAIRDFVRMIYERGNTSGVPLKYLLLFGDGSFDMKDRLSGNTNFIPTYQSYNSLSRTNSYVSDDFYGFLDPHETSPTISGERVDIGIGRFPVKNTEEARNAVRKSIDYYDNNTFGDWRNFIGFIADDGDGNIHMRDADTLARRVTDDFPNYNLDKIYFDAFPMLSTPGGQRYPEVNRAINNRVTRGALIVNYIGHGGETGWAHERVLEISDINAWQNKLNLPLFVTATCEFTRFDDPARTSGGEYVFLNPDGGGIGLLTTTRLVYSSPNFELSREFNKIAYDRVNGETPTLGDLTRITKNEAPNNVNTRCFTLIGDPALKLAYPQHRVVTIDAPDSIRPLDKVTFKGMVTNFQGQKLSDFNGTVQPTVFDKIQRVTTLNNRNTNPFSFHLQNNIIFRGNASVKNGEFEFSFVAPKDVSVLTGQGRISYYTQNAEIDGTGFDTNFKIGGQPNPNNIDNTAPEIDLFMNNENFVSGGITNKNPLLLAKLFDENGINTVGTGIGHDITAILNRKSDEPIVLNDFYISDIDSYQSGSVRYQFNNLEPGNYNLKLTAWDVHNNPASAEIDFIVTDDEKVKIDNVLNYPNPFTTSTEFMFDHNQAGRNLDIRVQVFTISGKVVRTIDANETSNGFKGTPIHWDGRDDFGDKIGRGVYVYKMRVRNDLGEVAEKFEKLVIL